MTLGIYIYNDYSGFKTEQTKRGNDIYIITGMMKKRILVLIIMLAALFVFVACQGGGGSNEERIVGRWEHENIFTIAYEFNADYSGSRRGRAPSEPSGNFTWVLDGDELSMTFDDSATVTKTISFNRGNLEMSGTMTYFVRVE